MLGAIFGDIVGSPYEHNPIKTTEFPLFIESSHPTDDSVLTIAVAKGLMDSISDKKSVYDSVVSSMRELGNLYPNSGYGASFYQWLKSDDPKPYGSFANGAAMRVSPVAWLFGSLEDVEYYAEQTAIATHDHPDAIEATKALSAAIFMARIGESKFAIRNYISKTYGYDPSFTLDDIRPTYSFDITCKGSVCVSLVAFHESRGFEDAIRKSISLGGDSDTLAAITGSIAEAYYSMPAEFKRAARRLLPEKLATIEQKWEENLWHFRDIVGVEYDDGTKRR